MAPLRLYALIAVLSFVVLYIVWFKHKYTIISGVVIKKKFCRANFDDSFVTIRTLEDEILELKFETFATLTCKHKDRSECFHGKGDGLDDRIALGDAVRVRILRKKAPLYEIHRLIGVMSGPTQSPRFKH